MIKTTNKATGEVIEMPAKTLDDLVEAWQIAGEYIKTGERLRDQLKKTVPNFVSDRGTSDESGGRMFRVYTVQRSNYDKAVMRRVMDNDLFDTLLKPDKTAVDTYLKENLPEWSSELRDTMIEEGKPYEVIKLERVTNESLETT